MYLGLFLHTIKDVLIIIGEAVDSTRGHSIWAGQELYRKGNTQEEFYNILQKNMQPVYDSARRQEYEIWNR